MTIVSSFLTSALCPLPFALALVSVTGAQVQPPAPRPDTSVGAVVEAAAAYVRDYQDQLTYVIADESYVQRILNQAPLDTSMPRSRTLKSEMFFMFGPADRVWMAIRDVIQVDGKPVDQR